MSKIRWIFNFTTWEPHEHEIAKAFATIQSEERSRIGKFVYQADLKASLCGRLMLRLATHLLTAKDNQQIQLCRTDRGRPYVKDHPEVHLNISHAGKYTILAAQTSQNDAFMIGTDIMPLKDSRIDRTENFFRLMNRQFTDSEWKVIKGFESEEEQLASFYRHWSLKESYVKAVGTGLNIDLRTINFKINTAFSKDLEIIRDTKVEVNGVLENWSFEEMLYDNHAISVALNHHQDDISSPWKVLNASELMTDNLSALDELDLDYWKLYSSKEPVKPF